MKIPNGKMKLVLATGVLGAALVLGGCADDKGYSELRVIHASKDAPPVNVRVGFKNVIKNLDYADSSGYLSVRSGTKKVLVKAIIPGGNAVVIKVDRFEFEKDLRYNILAVNDTATIEALVVEESAAEPSDTEVAIAVVHASTNANEVDVYVTAPGVPLNSVGANFSFDYTDVVDVGALPTGPYQIRVTAPGTKNVVYDSGTVDLSGFGGDKVLLAAISSVNDSEALASPIKLLAANDIARLILLDEATNVGAKVVHLSPDAGTLAGGPVEVFATSPALGATPVELIPAFAYTDIVPGADSYVDVPAGNYVFDVAPDTDTIGDSVYTSPSLKFSTGDEYSIIAAGNVGGGPAFTLLVTGDENRSIVTQSSLKVVHAAPAAGNVDVFVTPAGDFTAADVESGAAGDPLLDGFAFADITGYVNVPPGDYDIRVVPEATGTTAINVEGLSLTPGLVATAIARQPDGDGVPADFNLLLLTN